MNGLDKTPTGTEGKSLKDERFTPFTLDPDAYHRFWVVIHRLSIDNLGDVKRIGRDEVAALLFIDPNSGDVGHLGAYIGYKLGEARTVLGHIREERTFLTESVLALIGHLVEDYAARGCPELKRRNGE